MESQNQLDQESKIIEIQEKPKYIVLSDDCIELKPQEFKLSILKHNLRKKQQKYSKAKILFGFRFDFKKARCLFCRKKGHVNCCQASFQFDNIYKNQ